MGRLHAKDVLENLPQDQSFRLVHGWSITLFLRKTSEEYHRGENDYRCKSLTNSKTIPYDQEELIFAELNNSNDNNVCMKLQTLQIMQILIECRIMLGWPRCTHANKTLFRLKITVGCSPCTCPSIRVCGVCAMCAGMFCGGDVCVQCGRWCVRFIFSCTKNGPVCKFKTLQLWLALKTRVQGRVPFLSVWHVRIAQETTVVAFPVQASSHLEWSGTVSVLEMGCVWCFVVLVCGSMWRHVVVCGVFVVLSVASALASMRWLLCGGVGWKNGVCHFKKVPREILSPLRFSAKNAPHYEFYRFNQFEKTMKSAPRISVIISHMVHRVGKKVLPGLFLGYALYTEWIWKGDIMDADVDELERMDASEIHLKKTLNAKEYFPKNVGGDQELRTSAFIREHPIRGESQRDFLGESEGSPPSPLQDSFPDASEARNDFWSMSGSFIYRHHVEPRVTLYSPTEESFPIPLKYIDVYSTYAYKFASKKTSLILGKSMDQEMSLILGLVLPSLLY